jgi:hypothetical protein
VIFEDLHNLLTQQEADASLFAPPQLRRRIEALDELDAHLGGYAEYAFSPVSADSATLEGAATLRQKLEAANAVIYSAIRQDICEGNPDCLRKWIHRCRDAPGDAEPGLGYDHLDDLIAGVLQIRQPSVEVIHSGPEQVFYQPTPIRHALSMIERSGFSASDVLIDFGSGLGQFCIVASVLTGARAIGIELEAAYVDSARRCAQSLQLNRVSFLHADARQADLANGTVYHVYTPFTGSILRTVLNRLQQESTKRPITISTLGPCTDVIAQEPWLRADAQPDADRVTVFRS